MAVSCEISDYDFNLDDLVDQPFEENEEII